ncbi:MAG: hypothetical protein LBD94_01175 [Rickettsiales bacterium]|nr:hypothetical protein [Rickettsiales bacterium]
MKMRRYILCAFCLFFVATGAFASCSTGYENSDDYKVVEGTDCGTGYESTDEYKIVEGTDCGAGYEATDNFLPDSGGSLSDNKGSYSYTCNVP